MEKEKFTTEKLEQFMSEGINLGLSFKTDEEDPTHIQLSITGAPDVEVAVSLLLVALGELTTSSAKDILEFIRLNNLANGSSSASKPS